VKAVLNGLQRIGRALMLPIAVLPIAALLLRLGQADLLDIPAMAAAGQAIFDNLGLLFAIGVAVGLARENHGAAGLAAVVGFLVATRGAEVLIAVPPEALGDLTERARELAANAFREKELAKLSVPVGILSGLIAGVLYNRYSTIRLPEYLAFFGGRRFVPIASGIAGLVLAFCFGYGWPVLEHGMDVASRAILDSGGFGLFAYGVLNRLLIITGLHHILNNLAWFFLGDYAGATGDLRRYFAGDPSAGAFMSGHFPVMMFGLPAACLAMYRTARPERRKAVGGLLLSTALTSFLTGVTEPIEFTFMFLAPILYAIHAVLTGVSMVLMDALGVRLGFGFSAGLFDYVLNFNLATRPWWLLPIGVIYFALYYGLFRFFILRFDLKTPGRDLEPVAATQTESIAASGASAWIAALGGAKNLLAVDACTTRLRLQIVDSNAIHEEQLKRLGARGVVRPGPDALQVVVGPQADQLAGDISTELRVTRAGPQSAPAESRQDQAVEPTFDESSLRELLRALGEKHNVASVESHSTRMRIAVVDPSKVDEAKVRSLGWRGIARPSSDILHVIVGPAAAQASAALRQLAAV
jgi:N-acetylglucosamine PTS system EIICBA or EIICB component